MYATSIVENVQMSLPCASSYQSFPVMAAAVNEDVSCDTVAAMGGEFVLAVALLGRRLVPLHRQVVMGHPQLLVS